MQEQQKSMSNLANVGISHATSQPSLYNDMYQQQQPFPPQMPPNQYGTLPHKSSMFYGAPDPMASARSGFGMPFVGSQPNQTFFPSHMQDNSQNMYAMPNVPAGIPPPYPGQANQPYYPPQQTYPLQPSNSHGALHLAHQQSMQQSPFQPHQMPMQTPYMYNQAQPNPMSYSMYEPHQMNGDIMSPPMMGTMNQMADPYSMQQQNTPNSFRLHQPYVICFIK